MTLLIVNSRSGEGQRDLEFWRRHLNAAGLEEFDELEFSSDGWRDAIGKDDLVLAAGGDGTISAVAGACVEAGAILAILPSGTANDFARSLGIEDDAGEACRIAVDGMDRRVDVGLVDGRVFINVLHVGLGAEASFDVEEGAKSDWGQLSYVRCLIDRVGCDTGFPAEISVDDERLDGDWLEIGIANGAFYGGGYRIPDTSPHDGRLNLFGVRPDHVGRLAAEYARVKLLGLVQGASDLLEHRVFKRCRIETESPQRVTADGEEIAQTPVEIEIRAGALRTRVADDQ